MKNAKDFSINFTYSKNDFIAFFHILNYKL